MVTFVRAAAHNFLTRRDGFGGWHGAKSEFADLVGMPLARIREQSERRLSRLLRHAFTTVPYYRQAWKALGFTADGPFSADALQHLPITTKDTVRTMATSLMSDAFAPSGR